MPSSILNSDDGVISGTSGIKAVGGDDGVLVFQSKGTETARINTDKQIVAAAGTASLPVLTTTGDVNTGIYFPAADTIGFVCGGTEDFRVDGDGQLWNTINSEVGTDYTTLYKGYFCRAWVNFNGTGTVAIRASGNVTSITDNGTGDYTVNFTTAMPDANYGFAFGLSVTSGSDGAAIMQSPSASPTGSAFRIVVGLPGSISGGLTSNLRDFANLCVSIFR